MTRTLEEYLDLPYAIEITPDVDDEGNAGWVAEVRDLPGCMTQVATLDELEASVRDAMAGWLSVAMEDGRDIPEPREASTYSGRFLLRLPRSLHAQLARQAEEEGVSLNQLAMGLLAAGANWRSAHHQAVA